MTLVVQGTSSHPVTFAHSFSTPDNGDWGGIYVGTGASASINHAIITHPAIGVEAEGASNVEIYDSRVEETSHQGFLFINSVGVIENNQIVNDFYGYYQDGIYVLNSDVNITGNSIQGNYRTGVQIFAGSQFVVLTRNVISNNGFNGGAYIQCANGVLSRIENNTIAHNSAQGLWVYPPSSASLIWVKNNIVAYNSGRGIWNGSAYYSLPVDYNDVYNNSGGNYYNTVPGDNDISLDPDFVGGDPFDYHLQNTSPCIDAGDPQYEDPDGSVADIGAYYYPRPDPPTNLTLTSYTHYHIGQWHDHPKLTWDPNTETDLDHYKVYRKVGSGSWSSAATVPAGTEEWIDFQFTIVPGGNTFLYYNITAWNINPPNQESDPSNEVSTKTNTGKASKSIISSESIPEKFVLHRNYPNPFNLVTTIKYDLPEKSYVEMKIFNLLGEEIRTLAVGKESAGFKNMLWNGKDNRGNLVSSGMYIYNLSAKSLESDKKFHQTMKMVLLR